jgi:hypothetical protein
MQIAAALLPVTTGLKFNAKRIASDTEDQPLPHRRSTLHPRRHGTFRWIPAPSRRQTSAASADNTGSRSAHQAIVKVSYCIGCFPASHTSVPNSACFPVHPAPPCGRPARERRLTPSRCTRQPGENNRRNHQICCAVSSWDTLGNESQNGSPPRTVAASGYLIHFLSLKSIISPWRSNLTPPFHPPESI